MSAAFGADGIWIKFNSAEVSPPLFGSSHKYLSCTKPGENGKAPNGFYKPFESLALD